MGQRFVRGSCVLFVTLLVTTLAIGHAILMKSTPGVNQVVTGPEVPVVLTFNSQIDRARSTLTLERPNHSSSRIAINSDASSPAKLIAKLSDMSPGSYQLRWQVLAVDGHITRGAISFRVK